MRSMGAAACVLAVVAIAAPSATAADPGFEKQSYTVPVTQPDETGQPVSLDTDVYLPTRPAPASGHPFIELFHGGGSNKTNGFDAAHAQAFAERGYVVVLYSARGHGESDGQTTIIGPKEIRDMFDVAAWAIDIGGRDQPPHPDFEIDRRRIGLSGYSQGGLHTNLGQAHSSDPELNPYGIRFRALEPANTAANTFEALVPNEVVKLSFGAGIAVQSYLLGTNGRISPLVAKWTATAGADVPQLYGGATCERGEHDTLTSTMKADFAERSPACFIQRLTPPSHWAQSFDDGLFPADMGIQMWKRMPHDDNRLYLGMGGHGAPSAQPAVEADKLRDQIRFFDHHLRGRPLRRVPPVVYWTRDPAVAVPSAPYAYPEGAWRRHAAPSWPPPEVRKIRYQLGADGAAVRTGAEAGELPLAPLSADLGNDPVGAAALSATPLGTSPVPRQIPATDLPGFVAGFETKPFASARELSGAAKASVRWTPESPDTQLVLKLFDRAPDGTMTLLGRGVRGLRGETPGEAVTVDLAANHFSSRVAPGHSLVAWVTASEVAFFKPYVPSAGGTLEAGPGSTLTLPLSRPR